MVDEERLIAIYEYLLTDLRELLQYRSHSEADFVRLDDLIKEAAYRILQEEARHDPYSRRRMDLREDPALVHAAANLAILVQAMPDTERELDSLLPWRGGERGLRVSNVQAALYRVCPLWPFC